jgi:signal transduction histidine kinase
MFIPITQSTPGTAQNLLSRIPLHQKASLRTHAAILGGCIESADSYINLDKADNLIGTLGHEIRGPIAALGQSAIFLVYEAIDVFEKLVKEYGDPEYKNKLDLIRGEELTVSKQMQSINTLMSVAIELAQQSGGIIQVHFEKANLYEVMKSASDQVSEIDYFDYRGNKHLVKFVYNEASQRMPPLVIDKNLIHSVFVNIFTNAHKYSLPPGHGKPININIYGIPQSNLNIIQVENWGIAIPSDVREKIFTPYQRGFVRDPRKARGGMGLGLYICRKFIAIHKGSIFCERSEPTFSDPERRKIEGWRTVFEIRLPLNLKEGTYEVNF